MFTFPGVEVVLHRQDLEVDHQLLVQEADLRVQDQGADYQTRGREEGHQDQVLEGGRRIRDQEEGLQALVRAAEHQTLGPGVGHRGRGVGLQALVQAAAHQTPGREVGHRDPGVDRRSNPQAGDLVVEVAAVLAAVGAEVPFQMPRNMPEGVEAVVHQVAAGAAEVRQGEEGVVVHCNIRNRIADSSTTSRTARTKVGYSMASRALADSRSQG